MHPNPYHSAISSVFPVSSSLRGAVRSEVLPVKVQKSSNWATSNLPPLPLPLMYWYFFAASKSLMGKGISFSYKSMQLSVKRFSPVNQPHSLPQLSRLLPQYLKMSCAQSCSEFNMQPTFKWFSKNKQIYSRK